MLNFIILGTSKKEIIQSCGATQEVVEYFLFGSPLSNNKNWDAPWINGAGTLRTNSFVKKVDAGS